MKLFYHPVSSYSQKALIAFYEKGAKFEPMLVNLMDPEGRAQYRQMNPLGKIPFLQIEEKDWAVPESSIIIEYIDRHCKGGTKLIPDDPDLARQVRYRDRFMDNYVNDQIQKIFFDGLRPEGKRDALGVEQARETLNAAFWLLDKHHKGPWALGDTFSMADCAAAPPLFYARMVHPFDAHKNVVAYFNRLAERPSVKRVFDEAQPFLAKMAK